MKAFLSHSSKDKELVRAVASILNRHYCLFDEQVFDTGKDFKESIESSLDDSTVFVFFASSKSLESIWVKLELEEAWYQRLRKNLASSLVYIVDSSVDITSLPDWLKKALIRRANSPQQIARDIRDHIDNLLIERQSPYFSGRGSDIESLERVLTPLDGSAPPRSFLIFGLPGIGRKTLIKHVIPSILQLKKFVPINVGEGDSIKDICISVADKVEPYNTSQGLLEIIKEIKNLSDDNALQRIVKDLSSMNQFGEFPIFVDSGGLLEEEGYLREEITKIIDATHSFNQVYAAYITFRRPHVDTSIPFPIIPLNPLEPEDTKRLLTRLLGNKGVSINVDQIDELAEYVKGYPPAAFFVAQLCKDYGIELMLSEKASLTRFTLDIFLRHFSTIGLSRDEKRILRLLAYYSPLPLGTINLILEIDDHKLDNMLMRMIDLALLIPTDCHHYQIADPISGAAIKAFGFLSTSEHAKVAKSIALYLGDSEIEGPQLQLSRLLFKASRLSGDTDIAGITIHFANDLIKLTEDLYHQRKYPDAIETGLLALAERPNSITARRYLIRSLIQEENWTEANKQIEEFKKYAPNREILYHLGFLNRYRGNLPEAIKYYTQAKELGWTGIAISRELANCYFLSRDFEPAAKYIREARLIRNDNRFVVDLEAQIAIARGDKDGALKALGTLKVIDDPIFYWHRLSTFERKFGTIFAALDAAEKAAESEESPPFAVLVQLATCQIDSSIIPKARDTIKRIEKRYGYIKNDVRFCLQAKLEIADKHYSEAIRLCARVKNKDTDIYKRLIADALRGELTSAGLDDQTRKEYQSKLDVFEKQLAHKAIEEVLSLIFDSEQS